MKSWWDGDGSNPPYCDGAARNNGQRATPCKPLDIDAFKRELLNATVKKGVIKNGTGKHQNVLSIHLPIYTLFSRALLYAIFAKKSKA